jgi:DNA-binding NtrC family response regulator
MDPSVLILDQSSSPCAAEKCGSLIGLIQRSLGVKCVQERCGIHLPGKLTSVPDLILLRFSAGPIAQELVAACKKKWNRVSILFLLCPKSDRLAENLPSVLAEVDDFLSCPFQDGELFLRVKRLLQAKSLERDSLDIRPSVARPQVGSMVGESEAFVRAMEKVAPLARAKAPVLILGETGTGKELFARALHYEGPRHGKPFIPLNCGALPDHLFENELFGHIKGAFTDASSAEKGLIAEAEGGTLFLDEVDALSQAGQVKLLRFLQDGEYRPVGSARSVNADVRVIAATNADLKERVEGKLFREDLYYRLNSLSLSIPSLRDRIEDVVALTEHFLERYATEHGQRVCVISSDALDKLMTYSWPGNVRELESVITRALTFTPFPILKAQDIELPSGPGDESPQTRSLREAKTRTIEDFERRYLASLLAQHRGNVTHAAKAAGKERRSFQRLLRKHNLNRDSFHG